LHVEQYANKAETSLKLFRLFQSNFIFSFISECVTGLANKNN